MKKIMLCITALLCSITLANANASNMITNKYSEVFKGVKETVKDSLIGPVNISIINASSDVIYVYMPDYNVRDMIAPGYNDHIYVQDYIRLLDPSNDPRYGNFFGSTTCRYEIITVYGYPGNYGINRDIDLCR